MSIQATVTKSAPPLAELASAALHDRRDLEALLARSRPIVYAIVLDRVHSPDLAEDLTQDALADVAQSLSSLREPDAFQAWLRQIAVNRCRMWWRRPVEDPEPLSESYRRLVHADAFVEAARRETWRELQRALEDLPEKSRLALLIHVFGGMTHAEIAEALDASVSVVAVRIHRARQRLRQTLAPISEEEWRNGTLRGTHRTR